MSETPLAPHNLEAEELVLGAMMLTPRACEAAAAAVDAADFYRASHARIYQAAQAIHTAGGSVDAVTIADRLQQTGHLDDAGGIDRVREISQLAPDASRAAHWATIVARLARLRTIHTAAQAVARAALDGTGNPDTLEQQLRQLADQPPTRAGRITVETWHTFETQAHDRIPCLVDGLWPEAAFGFIAAPPKKGKTWVALALAISVATGRPLFGHFAIPKPQPVLYVALEGHRAALRARIGAIARGTGANPDRDDLANLHLAYRPAGINLTDAAWARELAAASHQLGAALVIVDVLRAGATIKENDASEFAALRHNLQPITDAGTSIALLHHFGKLTELQRDRDPGERMSGTGAMFGALDAAIYITGSEDHAKRLRLDFDTRDIATPEHQNLVLTGEGSGPNGGFTYRDAATFTITTLEIEEEDLKAPPAEIRDYVTERGGTAKAIEVCAHFDISSETLTRRLGRLLDLGITLERRRGSLGNILRADPESITASPSNDVRQWSLDAAMEPHEQAKPIPIPAPLPQEAYGNGKSADLQDNPITAITAPLRGDPQPPNGAGSPDTNKDTDFGRAPPSETAVPARVAPPADLDFGAVAAAVVVDLEAIEEEARLAAIVAGDEPEQLDQEDGS